MKRQENVTYNQEKNQLTEADIEMTKMRALGQNNVKAIITTMSKSSKI